MAKTKIDEEYVKKIMAGMIPRNELDMNKVRKEIPEEEPPVQISKEVEEKEIIPAETKIEQLKEENTNSDTQAKSVRKRKSNADYTGLFLYNTSIHTRICVHVDRNIHEDLSKILNIISPNTSFISYLNNILKQHIEQYREEINDLYDNAVKNPLK